MDDRQTDSETAPIPMARRILFHALELVILCVLLAGCGLVLLAPAVLFAPMQGQGFTEAPETAMGQFFVNFWFVAALVPYLGGVLLLTRVMKWRWLFLALADLWLVAVPGYLYYRFSYPRYIEVLFRWPEILGEPGVMVSLWAVGIFLVVPILGAVLGGLYAVRKGFAWWKYGVGAAAALAVAYALLFWGVPFQPTIIQVMGFLLILLFAFGAILLPLQRGALERLTGIGLRPRGALIPAAPWGWWTSLLGHATLCGVLGAAVFGGFLGSAIIQSIRLYIDGPPAEARAQGEVNAFQFWNVLVQPDSGEGPATNALRSECLAFLAAPTTPRENRAYWEGRAPGEVEEAFAAYQAELDEVRQSRAADYFDPRDPQTGRQVPISFSHLRKTGRLISARALWLLYQGKPDEALEGIRDQFQMAYLLRESTGPLLTYLMVSSFQQMAVGTGYSYLLAVRDDRDSVEALLRLLTEEAVRVRRPFPVARVRASDFAFRSLVPYFEINVPRLTRAVAYYYHAVLEFDQLILATAAEAWRLDHDGGYPDSPQSLIPNYIDRIPVDPFMGKAYTWSVENGELVIGHSVPDLPSDVLPFPASKAVNAALLECAEQSDAEASRAGTSPEGIDD